MAWFFGQSLLYIALAFLLGLLVGWLTWGQATKPTTDQHKEVAERPEPTAAVIAEPVTEAKPATEAKPVAEAAPVVSTEPARVAEPEPVSVADNGPVAEPEPVAVAEIEPTVEPEAVTEPKPAVEPEPVAVADAEPITEPEPVAVAAVEPEAVIVTNSEPAIEPVAVADGEPSTKPEPAADVEPIVEPEPLFEPDAVVVPAPVVEPALATASTDKPDNLQRIEGIGPKISMVLVASGIRTYEQLANSDEATLAGALRKGGLRLAPSLTTWSAQAALLAKGDEAGFAALTRELVASRRGR